MKVNIDKIRKYFDIQVLMMVTETETFTSTLHHIYSPIWNMFFC